MGATVAVDPVFGGPIGAASMNPACSTAVDTASHWGWRDA
jgi:hypothetical protein